MHLALEASRNGPQTALEALVGTASARDGARNGDYERDLKARS